ncbi:hypothetical protein [Desulfobacca acetoxidans]|uniref:hypothetical protein n=1 Tax=Desulfobacca acetoxidans TaxID=60893 RepID=UPI00059C0806|nr:hypothetical protein [Desulfobacca acetoxidans]
MIRTATERVEFSKKSGRILKDALRLKKKELPEAKYRSGRSRLDYRLDSLMNMSCRDGDVKRLMKRLRWYRQVFYNSSVAWGEYQICPYGWACWCCSVVRWARPTIP